MKNIGLYIHIPFCSGKCPYCDFYSINNSAKYISEYVSNLIKIIYRYKNSEYAADTVYFGGGTPGIIGTENLVRIYDAVKEVFGTSSIETTLEVNPESAKSLDFKRLAECGFNRISIGLQSSDEDELKWLGRKHTPQDAAEVVQMARNGGIGNISLDLMIGLENQTFKSLKRSIEFCADLNVNHISSYILKIEKGTYFYKYRNRMNLPDDDEVCDQYEFMVNILNKLGYHQYEISNFCKEGYESKHNLKYWDCEEYIGLGPSAHSFLNGKRFFYNRSLRDFYEGKIIEDGSGGDEEEYIAMQLRLTDGIRFTKFKKYFGYDIPQKYIDNAHKLYKTQLITFDDNGFRLTVKGFLCSNSVIVSILT